MGIWGPGSLENDDALVWVADLESFSDDELIVEALNAVINQADDYPEEPGCSVAIAAAEVVATQLGNPSEDCPEEIETWVEERPAPSATRITQARQVIEAIQTNSELKDFWKEAGSLDEWQAVMEDLLSRLSY